MEIVRYSNEQQRKADPVPPEVIIYNVFCPSWASWLKASIAYSSSFIHTLLKEHLRCYQTYVK